MMLSARLAVWLLLMLGGVAAVRAVTGPVLPDARGVTTTAESNPVPDHSVQENADSLTAVIIDRNLFRLGRRPAVATSSAAEKPVPQGPVPAPRRFHLLGIVAGRVPSAVVEGLPGATGARVVREGERFGDYLVKRIREGRVDIVGIDTLWVLRLKEQGR
ncbi:MAG: hypothetical protein GTN78_24065 [Gemmatimonadales bacterium]|nr:hypothetical protein [Gemmatimonadales bacterium]NIN11949.1 hypothetical protein [Gemmatimonadales bacterium]NIR03238.1 hypothetical protein [Gemmatimonadales bacterium]NIS66924.1 hypothetical protein [Gemmatimonadales bacterium]